MLRCETYNVEVAAPALTAFDFLSDVAVWPTFSPFARSVTRRGDHLWVVQSPQGEIELETAFDRERMLLDHYCGRPGEDSTLIPYRVIALPRSGCLLVMTNIAFDDDDDDSFAAQVSWMRQELDGAKRQLERRSGLPE